MKIAITGSSGFIGSNLAESLSKDNQETTLLTGETGNAVQNNAIVCDLLNYKKLVEHLHGSNTLVHLAGLNSVRDSFFEPGRCLEVNTIGTTQVLEACRAIGINKIVIISSAEVYGNPLTTPTSEEDILAPLSPYGVSKLALEKMAYVYYKAYNIDIKILRPFSIYGPNMSSKSLISEIYKQAITNETITLFNTSSVRDYCYVDDLVSAINNAINSPYLGFEVFNIGSGKGTSSKELAETILKIMNISKEVAQATSSDRPKLADVNDLLADVTKAKQSLNWSPQTSLEDGLTETLKFLKDGE
ncbi:MAG: nucleoside-diphosphate-sugar epimerase [Daejeonella sp.]|nr:nucleoside-diphosphate-sugar epimerase [Daejeonella sp.]